MTYGKKFVNIIQRSSVIKAAADIKRLSPEPRVVDEAFKWNGLPLFVFIRAGSRICRNRIVNFGSSYISGIKSSFENTISYTISYDVLLYYTMKQNK